MLSLKTWFIDLILIIQCQCIIQLLVLLTTSKYNSQKLKTNNKLILKQLWMAILIKMLHLSKVGLNLMKINSYNPLIIECLTKTKHLIKTTKTNFTSQIWSCYRRLTMLKKFENINVLKESFKTIKWSQDKLKKYRQLVKKELLVGNHPQVHQVHRNHLLQIQIITRTRDLPQTNQQWTHSSKNLQTWVVSQEQCFK